MSENGPSSTLANFWRGCDHLMGFKEFIDIRRSETHTWLEISNRDGMFEWKAVGSFGDGMLFHKDYFDRLVIFVFYQMKASGTHQKKTEWFYWPSSVVQAIVCLGI